MTSTMLIMAAPLATVNFGPATGLQHGAKKAINALATTATQAVFAFGEIVHPVIELGSGSYENTRHHRTIHDPKLTVIGYVTDTRAREVNVISDADIITRPTASRAKLRRETKEPPAL